MEVERGAVWGKGDQWEGEEGVMGVIMIKYVYENLIGNPLLCIINIC